MNRELKTYNDFIAFFADIPENQWGMGDFVCRDGTRCALGHLGMEQGLTRPRNVDNLLELGTYDIVSINDGNYVDKDGNWGPSYGDHPKERVINYLKALRDGKA